MVSPISPRRRRLASLVLVCTCLGGCVTTAVSVPKKSLPAEVAVAEKDLLAPLRPKNIVIANDVLVQVSPNFFNKVTRPSGGVRRRTEHAEEIVWDVRRPIKMREKGDHRPPGAPTNSAAAVGRPELKFVIEGTMFLVTNKLHMRILHRAPPTLLIAAKGDVRLLTDKAANEQRFEELRFDQGRVKGKRAKN